MSLIRRILPLLSLIVLPGVVAAQADSRTAKSQKSDVEFHVSNYGMFGLDVAKFSGGFIVPRGSGKLYMFGGGVYFVATKDYHGVPLPLTFWTYDPQGGHTDAMPGDLGGTPSDEGHHIYHSELYDRTTGHFIGANQTIWPLWIVPSATVTPMSPGVFISDKDLRNTQGGLAGPAFLPGVDEEFVTRFHDTAMIRYHTTAGSLEGLPIGLQFQQTIYSWSGGPFKHVVVLKYGVKNISGTTLTNCSIGQLADIDVGDGRNDNFAYYSQHPELRLGYAWTEAESTPYGSLLMIQLEGPMVDEHGFLNNSWRQEFRQNGRVGVCRGWNIEIDPMRNSFAEMATDGNSGPNGAPGDARGMIGSGLFSMHPGDTVHFAMAFAVIDDRPGTPLGDAQVAQLIPLLNERYYQGFAASAPAPGRGNQGSAPLDLTLLPGTGSGDLRVRFSAGADATLRVFNMLGQPVATLARRIHDGESAEETIDMSALPSGVYLVELSSGGRRVTEKMVR